VLPSWVVWKLSAVWRRDSKQIGEPIGVAQQGLNPYYYVGVLTKPCRAASNRLISARMPTTVACTSNSFPRTLL
jgi:hypothetical protein